VRKVSQLGQSNNRKPAASTYSVATVYAMSGATFAIGNLLLARTLPAAQYGQFALLVALLNLSHRVAPLGLDGMVNRHPIDLSPALLGRLYVAAVPVTALVVLGTRFGYGLGNRELVFLAIGILAGATAYLGSALLQAQHRFVPSAVVNHATNFTVLLAGLLSLVLLFSDPAPPFAIVISGSAIAAPLVLSRLWRPPQERRPAVAISWKESLAYAGFVAGALAMQQLDRLVIPRLLSFEALASFSVLAMLVIAPFHVLQLAVEHTLLPRLRHASGPGERRALLRKESLALFGIGIPAGIIAVLIVPPVADLLLAGKYDLGRPLVLAAVVAGLLRVATGLARTTAAALGTTAELARLNLDAWLAVAVGVAGAVLGSRFGLAGAIYGTSLGWASLALVAVRIGVRHVRAPDGHVDSTDSAIDTPRQGD
jgi:O-antigen/teichoic acid export membrane protein